METPPQDLLNIYSIDPSQSYNFGIRSNVGVNHKVLVIAYYFPPMGLSGVQRTLKFVKYMQQYGWDATVLTAGAVGYYAFDQSLLEEAEKLPIHIERTSGFDVNSLLARKGQIRMPAEWLRKLFSRISNTIFVPDNKRGWAKQALKRACELHEREHFDVVYISAPPFSATRVGIELKRRFGLPFVVDYRDLWYGNQFAFYPTPLHRLLHQKQEYTMVSAADTIIVTNRQMKQTILSYYPFLTHDDISIIPHGFDPEDFINLSPEPRNTNKFTLGYAGIFYDFVTPKYFLQAFAQIVQDQPALAHDMELHFFGLLRKENQRRIKQLGLEQFVVDHGYQNHLECVQGITTCDVLWMMVGKARNADTISSGKLYEYFGAGKPIIACVPDGALAQSAQKYGAALITEPDNVYQIKLAILKLYKAWKEGQMPAADKDFIEQHRRDHLTEQLCKELNFVLDKG